MTETNPKIKNIPLAEQVIEPRTLSPQQYEVMLEVRDMQIEDLLHAMRQVMNNKALTDIIPILTRAIRERNNLEEQYMLLQTNFHLLNQKYNGCKLLTEHFK